MSVDSLTEIVRQWAQRVGQPPAAAGALLAGRDVQTLRRAAAHFAHEGANPQLTNAQRAGWSEGAALLRDMASTITDPSPRTGPRPQTALSGLFTPMERRVLIALARGGDLSVIAARVGRSRDTVKTHLARMKKRTGATSTTHLLGLAIAYGHVPVDVALGDEGGETR